MKVWRAPGRVNIIGEHIDYLGGLVLPFACDLEASVSCAKSGDDKVVITSRRGSLDGHIDAVVRALRDDGHEVHGVRGRLNSSIPMGAGLSSSTALEIAIAMAVTDGAVIAPDTMQRAEQIATGVPCGVMDQTAILLGRAGTAMLLDCAAGAHEPVAIPPSIGFIVVDTGTRRELADGRYAQRRAEVEAELAGQHLDEVNDAPGRRLRHAASEQRRVRDAVAAVEADDLAVLGEILTESHVSLRDDFEVSSQALDQACETVTAHEACAGARLVGAGFAGCVLAAVEGGAEESVSSWIEEKLPGATAYPVRAVDGAGAFS